MRLVRTAHLTLEPVPPFSFGLTVRKPAGWELFTPEEVFENDTLWTGIRFRERSIGLKVTSRGGLEDPRLSVSIYSQKDLQQEEVQELRTRLAEALGVEQDLREFYAFAEKDSILKHVIEDLYGMHDTQPVSLFNSVILSICLQMARLKRSNEMMDSINRNFGETLDFDGKRVLIQPSPRKIAVLDPRVFAKECNLGYRAKYIVASAKMLVKGFPTMTEITKMAPEQAKETLMELPGIGDYAADIINPHGGFPIDAWSVDVFGLLFFGREPEDRREAIEKVKEEGIRRWGMWSWMGFFYVAQDLKNLSRRLGVQLRLE